MQDGGTSRHQRVRSDRPLVHPGDPRPRGEQAGVELVAVNDPFGDAHTMAFLLKHDSVGGTLANEVKVTDSGFSIDGKDVKKLEEREPDRDPVGRQRRRHRHRVDRAVHRARRRPPST